MNKLMLKPRGFIMLALIIVLAAGWVFYSKTTNCDVQQYPNICYALKTTQQASIIITLNTPATTADQIQQQLNKFIAKLPTDVKVEHRFELVPQLLVTTNAQGFNALQQQPLIKSMAFNNLNKMATPAALR